MYAQKPAAVFSMILKTGHMLQWRDVLVKTAAHVTSLHAKTCLMLHRFNYRRGIETLTCQHKRVEGYKIFGNVNTRKHADTLCSIKTEK